MKKVIATIVACLFTLGFGLMAYGADIEWNLIDIGMFTVLGTMILLIIWAVWHAIISEKK